MLPKSTMQGSHCGLLPKGEASAKGFPQVEQVAWKPQVFDCLD